MVILLGGRTGRDGIGGATGSSKRHTAKSLQTMASEVQKGNAPEERKLQRLFRDGNVTRLIKRCNDFGAGGVSVAIGELADGLPSTWTPCARNTTVWTAPSLPSPNPRSGWPWSWRPRTQAALMAAAQRENLEAYPVAVVTEDPGW
ncbi:MAG: AIR synthase-related protein [Oscillospiraceae bacterium]